MFNPANYNTKNKYQEFWQTHKIVNFESDALFPVP